MSAAREREQRRLGEIRTMNAQEGFREIASSRNGRAWLWKLMANCEVFMDGYSPQPGATERHTGKRAVGLLVLAELLDFDPAALTLMTEENRNPKASAPEEEGEAED